MTSVSNSNVKELYYEVDIRKHQQAVTELLTTLPKFFLSTADRTGGCDVVGGDHSEEMVVFRTPHGYHNIYVCLNCLLEVAGQQNLKGEVA